MLDVDAVAADELHGERPEGRPASEGAQGLGECLSNHVEILRNRLAANVREILIEVYRRRLGGSTKRVVW